MEILLYGALLLSVLGVSGKQFAMKRCGALTPGLFNSVCINALRAVICIAVSVLLWLMTGGGATNALGHVCIVLGGIGTAINLLMWILASRMVSLIMIEAVTTVTTMIFPMLLAPLLYNGESATLLQWIGCIMILVAIFCFTGAKGEKKEGSHFAKILTVGICALGAGLAAISKKYYSYYVKNAGLGSNEYYTMMSFVVILVGFAVLFAVFYRKEKAAGGGRVQLPYKKVWIFVLLAAASLYVNELFAVYASALPSAVYYPLNRGLTVVFTFILDVLVFKDKVTVKKLIGLVLITVSVVFVNI